MKKLALLIILSFIICGGAIAASPADYKKYFEIDLDTPLPSLDEIKEKNKTEDILQRFYDYSWNVGRTFDNLANKLIVSYGNSEKRLKPRHEDMILEMLQNMPKETWEYIGPYLHQVPGMSEKVLNLPGIKETKNRFPTRIAPELQNIEGLEFLSPSLYFILMPEAWPSHIKIVEDPMRDIRTSTPKAPYRPEFFANLEKVLPFDNFNPQATPSKKITRSDLRTVSPTKDSLITLTDIKAVARTLEKVSKLGEEEDLIYNLLTTGLLLDSWDAGDEDISLIALKDLANPCSRLVQKFRLLGQESKLALAVSEEGFTTTEWGYTCDKTIRAYRASQMSRATALSLIAYKNDVGKKYLDSMPEKTAKRQRLLMQAAIQMYQAPFSDIIEARKYHKELEETFKKMNYFLLGNSIRVLE